MKSIFFLAFLMLFSFKVSSQVEFTYEYKVFALDGPAGELKRLHSQSDNTERYHELSEMVATLGAKGWRYLGISQKYDPSMPTVVKQDYVFERATRIDNKTVENAIASFRVEFERIAKQEADRVALKLKLELIEAMKDVKLYDDTYRNGVIEAAIQKFKIELDKAIKESKSSSKK